MRNVNVLLVSAAALGLVSCGSGQKAANNTATANTTAPTAAATPAANAATPANTSANQSGDVVVDRVRTTGDGNQVRTRELSGPNVQEPGARPMNADEIKDIERATGRPYQEGDSIHGRAEPVPHR